MSRKLTQISGERAVMQEQSKFPADLVYRIDDLTLGGRHNRTEIYSAIRAGKLVARKSGRRTLILDHDYRRWLASLPVREVVLGA